MAEGAGEPLYRAEALSFAVDETPILSPLALDIHGGSMVGIIGPNGSGKSTLVKLLARQQAPSGGVLTLCGRPVGSYGDREFARTVAYMPQFTPPADGMSVAELVALGRFPWHGALGRFSDDDRAKVAKALRRTDLTDFSERLVDSLSGGERQRCWLAMMLAQDTRFLILDEPTSALDIAHQAEMLELVRAQTRERGVAAIVVLHDVNMAARYCDEIVALKRGRVAARGTPAELVTAETLGALYGLPMGILPHPATGQPLGYVV
ncbi:ATP-binding cassette domain-containing protein [Mesorhizobium sp. CAU 1741]|uniref:ABC transporter ATP-binding protein n=1 Tax=Mesorhizobium sp. CAU 1741 TaxID=3140366 RepID=UPI00325ADA74